MSCPKRCITRWNNIFDICSWIVIHYDEIENFFKCYDNITLSPFQQSPQLVQNCIDAVRKWAPLLTVLMMPFKYLSNKLESDSTSSGYTYGYTQVATILLQQTICNSSMEEPGLMLLKNVHERIDFTESGTLLRLLFHLTPKGRQIYITSKQDNNPDNIKLLYCDFFPLQPNEESSSLIYTAQALFDNQKDHFVEISNLLAQNDLEIPKSLNECNVEVQGETTEMTVIPAFASNSVANEEEDTNDDDTYDEDFDNYLAEAFFLNTSQYLNQVMMKKGKLTLISKDKLFLLMPSI